MGFFIPEFERTAKLRKIAVYRFSISLLVPEIQRFEEEFQIKKWAKQLSKSIKINKNYDVMC